MPNTSQNPIETRNRNTKCSSSNNSATNHSSSDNSATNQPFEHLPHRAMAEIAGEVPASSSGESSPAKRKQRGILARIWRGVFGGRGEDYEKKLKHLSKEEASVHARMKRRALRTRKSARNVILFSAIVEVAAVAFAIVTVRSLYLNWTMKIVRCSPVILVPGLSVVVYTALVRFTRMLDRKDEKTLERLRAERKAKLDELKELTNYYTTQQLIQRYDLDPAAKAAAASVLASKLGADSGLKVQLGDESTSNPQAAKSHDVELARSSGGLRNRRQSLQRSNSTGSSGALKSTIETASEPKADGEKDRNPSQLVVEHHRGSSAGDGGWIARIAALLVGEDSSQCYALICGNCLRHNGLVRREDFAHTTYYCPHCHALNTSRQPGENDSVLSTGTASTPTSASGSIVRNLSNVSSALGGEVATNMPAAPQDRPAGSAE